MSVRCVFDTYLALWLCREESVRGSLRVQWRQWRVCLETRVTCRTIPRVNAERKTWEKTHYVFNGPRTCRTRSKASSTAAGPAQSGVSN